MKPVQDGIPSEKSYLRDIYNPESFPQTPKNRVIYLIYLVFTLIASQIDKFKKYQN